MKEFVRKTEDFEHSTEISNILFLRCGCKTFVREEI